jgi:hypothetical protein
MNFARRWPLDSDCPPDTPDFSDQETFLSFLIDSSNPHIDQSESISRWQFLCSAPSSVDFALELIRSPPTFEVYKRVLLFLSTSAVEVSGPRARIVQRLNFLVPHLSNLILSDSSGVRFELSALAHVTQRTLECLDGTKDPYRTQFCRLCFDLLENRSVLRAIQVAGIVTGSYTPSWWTVHGDFFRQFSSACSGFFPPDIEVNAENIVVGIKLVRFWSSIPEQDVSLFGPHSYIIGTIVKIFQFFGTLSEPILDPHSSVACLLFVALEFVQKLLSGVDYRLHPDLISELWQLFCIPVIDAGLAAVQFLPADYYEIGLVLLAIISYILEFSVDDLLIPADYLVKLYQYLLAMVEIPPLHQDLATNPVSFAGMAFFSDSRDLQRPLITAIVSHVFFGDSLFPGYLQLLHESGRTEGLMFLISQLPSDSVFADNPEFIQTGLVLVRGFERPDPDLHLFPYLSYFRMLSFFVQWLSEPEIAFLREMSLHFMCTQTGCPGLDAVSYTIGAEIMDQLIRADLPISVDHISRLCDSAEMAITPIALVILSSLPAEVGASCQLADRLIYKLIGLVETDPERGRNLTSIGESLESVLRKSVVVPDAELVLRVVSLAIETGTLDALSGSLGLIGQMDFPAIMDLTILLAGFCDEHGYWIAFAPELANYFIAIASAHPEAGSPEVAAHFCNCLMQSGPTGLEPIDLSACVFVCAAFIQINAITDNTAEQLWEWALQLHQALGDRIEVIHSLIHLLACTIGGFGGIQITIPDPLWTQWLELIQIGGFTTVYFRRLNILALAKLMESNQQHDGLDRIIEGLRSDAFVLTEEARRLDELIYRPLWPMPIERIEIDGSVEEIHCD